MTLFLVFSVTLFLALLFSDLANRSVLSMAALFLLAGFLAGPGAFNFLNLRPLDPIVRHLAELALVGVLYTDGMRAGIRDLARAWRLPGRALILGLPLTLLLTAALARMIAGVTWPEAFLIGAILSPTDPVFAAAIIGRKEIPGRLRHLLNVESGVNDGLALPIVLAFLGIVSREPTDYLLLGEEIFLGIAIGVAIPWCALQVRRLFFFGIAEPFEPLFAVAIAFLVLSVAIMTHANIYLAAFSAGVTVASVRPELREEFRPFGSLVTELLKLGALLVFGVLMSTWPFHLGWLDYLFVLLALVAARPLALLVALLWSPLTYHERITAGWFGPKGFASVIYGLLLFQHHVPDAARLFSLVAFVIAGSMLAHSSTDILVARWFEKNRPPAAPATEEEEGRAVSLSQTR
jgi:NhaP-type Na+/H+ or K+/H+ antiporter